MLFQILQNSMICVRRNFESENLKPYISFRESPSLIGYSLLHSCNNNDNNNQENCTVECFSSIYGPPVYRFFKCELEILPHIIYTQQSTKILDVPALEVCKKTFDRNVVLTQLKD